MATAAAAIIIRERRIVEALAAAGATSPPTARSLDFLNIPHGVALHRLKDHAVVRDAGDGRFYVDLEVWEALRRMRRRIALLMLLIVVALGILGGALGWLGIRPT